MNLLKALFLSQLCIAASSSNSSFRGVERELGDSRDSRIIGGNVASKGRYSYAVSLQDSVGHFCGGSLIAPNAVLSAAHCMQKRAGYKAVIGRHNLRTSEGEVRTVVEQIPHPNYNSGTTDYDYMILLLDSPTEADVDLIRLSSGTVPSGTAVTVMGWGDTNPSDSVQNLAAELMETEVYVISNGECEKSSGTVGGMEIFGWTIGGYQQSYSNQISENMMCATDSGEDSCQGDSGGPLVVRSSTGEDTQVGVVSWGVGCANVAFPGVYARVSANYGWIQATVCDISPAAPAWFGCGGQTVDTSSQAPDESQQAIQDPGAGGDTTTFVLEDFINGLGIFDLRDNSASRYASGLGRAGLVRLNNGEVFKSNTISLENSPFRLFKVNFSFHAMEVESDDLCLYYELDGGAITGEKCWSSPSAFDNSKWYDGESLVLSADNAKTLRIGFRVDGDDNEDFIVIDAVSIQGLA